MITSEQLKKLGFVQSLSIGKGKSKLRWKGAPLFWEDGKLLHNGQPVPVETIDDVESYIRSLNLKVRTGVKRIV